MPEIWQGNAFYRDDQVSPRRGGIGCVAAAVLVGLVMLAAVVLTQLAGWW